MKGHSAPVKSIAFNSDGSLLVSSGDDKLVKIWDVEKRKFIRSFTGGKGGDKDDKKGH
jgi:WD40 repeat protein